MPTWPLRSARPIVSMRPVSVTSPAPMMTPIMPNKDRVVTSEGIAVAVACASSIGVSGRVVIAVAAMMLRLSSRADCGDYGQAWTQCGCNVRIVKHDLHGDSLHDFGVVAGGIVGRQKRKLGPAGRRYLDDFAVKDFSGIFVDADFSGVSDFYVRELSLAIICLNPLNLVDERNHLGSRRDQLSGANLPLAHVAVLGCLDPGIAEVHLRDGECVLLAMEVSDELQLLRIQHGKLAALGIHSRFTAREHGFRLLQSRLPAEELGACTLVIGDHLFNLLAGRGIGRDERLLPATFRKSAVQVGLSCFD